jgi:hypothetical protein
VTAVVAAPAPAAAPAMAVALPSGAFIQPDRNDPLRKGAGKVTVRAREVALESDFQVTPGPDFHVLLVPKAAIRASADLANTMQADLGPLRAFKGGQTCAVPDGVDLAACRSVVTWSRTCSALISLLLAEAPGYWPLLRSQLAVGQSAGARVHDARIAAICLEHGVSELWSADRDFSRFPQLKVINPLVGP